MKSVRRNVVITGKYMNDYLEQTHVYNTGYYSDESTHALMEMEMSHC
jgi:hypothetical protein